MAPRTLPLLALCVQVKLDGDQSRMCSVRSMQVSGGFLLSIFFTLIDIDGR